MDLGTREFRGAANLNLVSLGWGKIAYGKFILYSGLYSPILLTCEFHHCCSRKVNTYACTCGLAPVQHRGFYQSSIMVTPYRCIFELVPVVISDHTACVVRLILRSYYRESSCELLQYPIQSQHILFWPSFEVLSEVLSSEYR